MVVIPSTILWRRYPSPRDFTPPTSLTRCIQNTFYIPTVADTCTCWHTNFGITCNQYWQNQHSQCYGATDVPFEPKTDLEPKLSNTALCHSWHNRRKSLGKDLEETVALKLLIVFSSDTFNTPYFQFCQVFSFQTAHKCPYSYLMQIHDSNYTPSLVRSQ